MDSKIATTDYTPDDYQAFAARLKAETDLFKTWWQQGRLADDPPRIGLALAGWLIGDDGRPLPRNKEVLARTEQQSSLVPTLASYHLAFNTAAQPLAGRPFTALRQELTTLWRAAAVAATEVDGRLAMIGSLPTAAVDDLDKLPMNGRQLPLAERILALCSRRPQVLDIEGEQRLQLASADRLLATAATSLRLQLWTTATTAASLYNASAMASAATVALAANSPYLFGKRSWQESRIPLYEQAIVAQPQHGGHVGPFPRTSFGSSYGRDALYGFFIENRQHYPVLLPVLLDEPTERLPHLRLHNRTIRRWNRPLVEVADNGKAYLGIEHNVMATGPTISDLLANTAFYVGLVHGLAESEQGPAERLPFASAERNFYAAARHGLAAEVEWFGGARLRLDQLIARQLLPMAARGLERIGVDAEEAAAELAIIEQRLESGQTGAVWQQAYVQRYGPDFATLLANYLELQAADQPVHDWPL